MPKIKTRKAAAKRFKLTGSGKIKRAKAFKSHNLSSKNANRKARLTKGGFVSAADKDNILRLLGK